MFSGFSDEKLAKTLGIERGVDTEAKLNALLKEKQAELVECTARTHNLPPAQKKRMRNRYASSVSRIRKKLMYYTLKRELETSRDFVRRLEKEVMGQRGSILYFQKENTRLKKLLEQYTQEDSDTREEE